MTPTTPLTPMTPTEEFLTWLRRQHHDASLALHDGDPAPKIAAWSDEEPVTLFGAFWFEAEDAKQARCAFMGLADKFSDCTAYSYDLIAHGVSGDLAYTVGHERASMRVDGAPTDRVLRVTQVYRRESGVWKVIHRHADDARRGPTDDATESSA
jgi:ketosteroid isomerase-like protein